MFNWRVLLWSLAAWTLVAVLFATVNALFLSLPNGARVPWARIFAMGFAGALVWTILTPAILELARRFPFASRSWPRRIPVHLPAAVAAQSLTSLFTFWAVPLVLGPLEGAAQLTLPLVLLNGAVFNLARYAALVAIGQTIAEKERSNRERLEAERLRAALVESQLQLVQAQLSPHFLFNALHSISELVHKDATATEEAIVWLGDSLRSSLALSSRQTLTLEEELGVLEPYLALQRVRYGSSLRMTTNVAPDAMSYHVPTFVLQPLVENATRHALQDGRPCEIDVRARSVNGSLELIVEDDGPGFDRFPPQEGIGLKNVRVRLASLFGSQARLEYANRDQGGARVTLRVPRMMSTNGSGDELPQR